MDRRSVQNIGLAHRRMGLIRVGNGRPDHLARADLRGV